MSQLPLIHHQFQTHACRETHIGGREKQTWLANKVAMGENKCERDSKCDYHIYIALEADTVIW